MILLTGCNSGIGKEALRVLTKRGAHVIAAARTVEKAQAACDDVGGETTPVACELSEPASVQACARQVIELGRPLDAIICNAGIMALPKLNQKHGYELQFFTNHIGHFILVTSLLDTLTDNGRVVMVSSGAHNGAPPEGIQRATGSPSSPTCSLPINLPSGWRAPARRQTACIPA
jgi:WW domain-containing oxidoreductase